MRGSYRAWQVRTVLRNRSAPGAVVLVYHRVEDVPVSGLGLAVSPAHFDEHLSAVRRLGVAIPLRDVVAGRRQGRSTRRMVSLTFDDGYADNLFVAKPFLEAHGVPATVFVTTGFIGADQAFWWDRLDRIAAHTGEDVRALRARLRALPPAELEDEVERLAAATGLQPAQGSTHRCMAADEIVRLAEGGLVDVGSHTVSHAALGMLPDAGQRNELAASKRALEEILGRPVVSLSYPFGGPADLGATTPLLAAQCGYQSACANWPGTVCRGTDVMRLPRFVVRDWDGDEFARRLGDWLRGRRVLVDG